MLIGKKHPLTDPCAETSYPQQAVVVLLGFVSVWLCLIRNECGLKEFAVETGDVDDGQFFGAYVFAFAMVGAVAKAACIHLPDHV